MCSIRNDLRFDISRLTGEKNVHVKLQLHNFFLYFQFNQTLSIFKTLYAQSVLSV